MNAALSFLAAGTAVAGASALIRRHFGAAARSHAGVGALGLAARAAPMPADADRDAATAGGTPGAVIQSPEGVITIGLDGRVLHIDGAALRMIDAASADAVVGEPFVPWVVAADQPRFLELFDAAFQGLAHPGLEIRVTRRGQAPHVLEMHGTPLVDGAGVVTAMVVSAHDLTDRRRSDRMLAWEKEALELIARHRSLNTVIDQLLLSVERHVPGALCSVLLLDTARRQLRHCSAPSLPAPYCTAIDGIAIGPTVGSCGTAAFENRQVIVADIDTDPLWAAFRELALGHGLKACWSTPIHTDDGAVVGTFATYYTEPRRPSPVELETIDRARSLVEIALLRHLSEQAVRESRARLDLALQSGALGVWEWFPRTGSVVYSELWKQMLGYDGVEIPPHVDFFTSRVHPDDLPQVMRRLQAHLDGNDPVYQSEHRMLTRSGAFKWVLDRGRIVARDAAGPLEMSGVVSDITALKEAEAALVASQQRYEVAVLGSSDGLWDWDMRSHSAYFSPRWKSMLGYADDEVRNEVGTWQALMHVDDYPQTRRALTDYLARRTATYASEFRMRCRDGGYKWILARGAALRDANGRAVRMAGSHTDITERKRAEDALRASQQTLSAVLDAIPVRVFWKNRDLVFLGCNSAFAQDAGLASARDVVGRDDFHMIWKNQAELYRADDRAVIEGGRMRLHIEEPQTTADGEVITLLTSKVPLRNAQGEVDGVLGTYLDITTRKRAEEEVRRLNATLEKRVQERTTELEAFSYSVSHDLRAPLRAIDGFVRILQEDYAERLDDEGRRLITVVSRSARQMGQLIDDLLQLSRLGRAAVRLAEVDMEGLARDVFEEIARTDAGRAARLEIGPLPRVRGDAALLRQVWVNLIGNAIKFSRQCETPVVEIGARRTADGLAYSVRDHGAGFDMRYVHKLFGVFQRLHAESEFEGTGVGLALVKRVVTMHGGQVHAEGAVDRGATFTFTLPGGTVQ